MKENIEWKVQELIELLNQDQRIITFQEKKGKLLKNADFLKQIDNLKNLDIYSEEYLKLKNNLFQNQDFKEYKKLENQIDLLILEINRKLKTLTKKEVGTCVSLAENIKEKN